MPYRKEHLFDTYAIPIKMMIYKKLEDNTKKIIKAIQRSSLHDYVRVHLILSEVKNNGYTLDPITAYVHAQNLFVLGEYDKALAATDESNLSMHFL